MKKVICLVIAICIISLAAFSVFMDYHGFSGKKITVSIPQGAGATEIVKILKENKVIAFSTFFKRYIRDDDTNLKPGIHTFCTSMGYEKALEELKRDVPLQNTITVTIPEGYEAREIGLLLEKSGLISYDEFLHACKEAHNQFEFLPDDGNVEGYLYPATYDFQPNENAVSIVHKMLSAFEREMYTEENLARADAFSMSFEEVLTLASIIEREAAKDNERAIVSSVFHNRLNKQMRLESCATVQYVLKERKDVLSIADTQIDSLYNTYLHAGLPPAPIASPGKACLKAALYPEETNYLFFVTDGTGGHIFSETYEEHVAAMKQ